MPENLNTAFEQFLSDIERAYEQLGHTLGWRFLNVSRNVLHQDPPIALITLNPGGRTIPHDHPPASCESGCSYIVESWNEKRPGHSPLQVQVQRLFSKISEHSALESCGIELLERTLIGYFIPFRSPRLKDLNNRMSSLEFGKQLWMKVFSLVHPKLTICIDRDTFSNLSTMIPQAFNCHEIHRQEMNTGWGNTKAKIVDYGNHRNIKLLRLPHLSTFKVFSRPQCEGPMNRILNYSCKDL